ncbi:hypothetical protein Sjap_023750 [Stephania japonica]|uniref:Uncharacterized protein n=1 Tax=Stephania japonica TaxID=461633 RepID=A0AAP0EHF9_9MAGN
MTERREGTIEEREKKKLGEINIPLDLTTKTSSGEVQPLRDCCGLVAAHQGETRCDREMKRDSSRKKTKRVRGRESERRRTSSEVRSSSAGGRWWCTREERWMVVKE